MNHSMSLIYLIFGKTQLEGKSWCKLLEFIEYVVMQFFVIMNE